MERIFFTLRFDPSLEARLDAQRQRVLAVLDDPAKQSRHRVHVTLAVYELASSDAMDQRLRAFCQRCAPPRLDIRSLGCFPSSGTIFAAPYTSAALLDLHTRLHQAMGQEVLFAYHLAPGRWCPHVTLGTGLSVAELGRALVAAADGWDVCSGTATAIGVLAHPAQQDRAEFAFQA